MNFFFNSRNFLRFIKNKRSSNCISNMKINNLKSRCIDKIDKRCHISLSNSTQSLMSIIKSLNILTNSDMAIVTSINTLMPLDNSDLNFIMNEDLVIDNW